MTQPNFLGQQSGEGRSTGEESQRYPYIQWINGDKNYKDVGGVRYTGGFAFKVDQYGGTDWTIGQQYDQSFSSGETEPMWDIGAAEIVVLAKRIDWYVQSGDRREYLPNYQKDIPGIKGRNLFLVFIKGAEEWHQTYGPMMLTIGGTNGITFGREILSQWADVHRQIEAKAGAKLDAYTFWMPVVPGDFIQPNPKHPTLTTPPKLDLTGYDPANAQDYGTQQYIGDDMMVLCAAHWDDAQEWARENPASENENITTGTGDGETGGYNDSDFNAISKLNAAMDDLDSPPDEGPRPNWQEPPPEDDVAILI